MLNGKLLKLWFFCLLFPVLFSANSVFAVTIKLGSPFPEGTPWDRALRSMAEDWKRITDGEVTVRIYPGGIAGDDSDMVRKMRFNQLDSAVLTSFGAKVIVPNSFVMSLPGLVQTEEELDMMLRDFAPSFDNDFLDQRFKVLSWSKAGWAYFFTTEPVNDIEDVRNMTLATNSSDREVTAQFKALKFRVVPISLSDLTVSLQSGMVQAYYAPPVISAAFQWFALAPNMIDLPMAPVLGCFLITTQAWNRIPQKFHDELLVYVRKMTDESIASSRDSNIEALKIMKENKLNVLSLNNSQRSDWYDFFEEGTRNVVGEDKWIDNDVFNAAQKQLENFRNQ